jgi:hypothetical protein
VILSVALTGCAAKSAVPDASAPANPEYLYASGDDPAEATVASSRLELRDTVSALVDRLRRVVETYRRDKRKLAEAATVAARRAAVAYAKDEDELRDYFAAQYRRLKPEVLRCRRRLAARLAVHARSDDANFDFAEDADDVERVADALQSMAARMMIAD